MQWAKQVDCQSSYRENQRISPGFSAFWDHQGLNGKPRNMKIRRNARFLPRALVDRARDSPGAGFCRFASRAYEKTEKKKF